MGETLYVRTGCLNLGPKPRRHRGRDGECLRARLAARAPRRSGGAGRDSRRSIRRRSTWACSKRTQDTRAWRLARRRTRALAVKPRRRASDGNQDRARDGQRGRGSRHARGRRARRGARSSSARGVAAPAGTGRGPSPPRHAPDAIVVSSAARGPRAGAEDACVHSLHHGPRQLLRIARRERRRRRSQVCRHHGGEPASPSRWTGRSDRRTRPTCAGTSTVICETRAGRSCTRRRACTRRRPTRISWSDFIRRIRTWSSSPGSRDTATRWRR